MTVPTQGLAPVAARLARRTGDRCDTLEGPAVAVARLITIIALGLRQRPWQNTEQDYDRE